MLPAQCSAFNFCYSFSFSFETPTWKLHSWFPLLLFTAVAHSIVCHFLWHFSHTLNIIFCALPKKQQQQQKTIFLGCWKMYPFKHDICGEVHLWLLYQIIFHLCWGYSTPLCTRIDSWRDKGAWFLEKGKVVTVLIILQSIHIVSVRLCIELLCRRQMETEASLQPSTYTQHANGESIM